MVKKIENITIIPLMVKILTINSTLFQLVILYCRSLFHAISSFCDSTVLHKIEIIWNCLYAEFFQLTSIDKMKAHFFLSASFASSYLTKILIPGVKLYIYRMINIPYNACFAAVFSIQGGSLEVYFENSSLILVYNFETPYVFLFTT